MIRTRLLMCVALLMPLTTHGQDTLYVTDKLFLGLYPEAEADSKALATLVSGTPLQILERGKYFSRVRTQDGKEGWVKSAYLVEDKPPRLLLEQVQTEREQLAEALQSTRAQLQELQRNSADANAQAQQLEAGRAQRSAALQRLQSENQSLRAQLNQDSLQVPLTWLIGAAALCLLLGLWGGYAWLDLRIRRRHGGFRVY